jgi:hypothetical protein
MTADERDRAMARKREFIEHFAQTQMSLINVAYPNRTANAVLLYVTWAAGIPGLLFLYWATI